MLTFKSKDITKNKNEAQNDLQNVVAYECKVVSSCNNGDTHTLVTYKHTPHPHNTQTHPTPSYNTDTFPYLQTYFVYQDIIFTS